MVIASLRSRHVPAALLALALLAAACGQTAPPPEVGGGAAVTAEPGRSAVADDPEPPPAPEDPDPAPAADAEPAADDRAEDGAGSAEEPAEPEQPEEAAEPEQPEAPEPDRDTAVEQEPPPQDGSASPPAREVVDNDHTPFAAVEGVTLHHPSSRVERVGFHQANHDGARQLEVLEGAIAPLTMDGRERATGSRSAADVVVDPEREIRAPVTGTVVRAGTYVLYCDYSDDFVVIEPDARPGWEVKLLHIDGVQVTEDQRVEAGRTVLAPRPTPLPFESQVDEHTAEPSWPHVHLEVVDPSIPNESSGGGC